MQSVQKITRAVLRGNTHGKVISYPIALALRTFVGGNVQQSKSSLTSVGIFCTNSRHFSASDTSSTIKKTSHAVGDVISSISEKDYNELADATLNDIVDLLDTLDDCDGLGDNVDINYSQGVLSIKLGVAGTWVINKQTPNRQIWWSSPVSGPRRYELHSDHTEKNTKKLLDHKDPRVRATYWRGTKGQESLDLLTSLRNELLEALDVDILADV